MVAASAAGQALDTSETLQFERALAGLVSEERAVQRVRELVELGPRMGGTRSGKRAADYLLRAFQEARIPTRLYEDPETWCHEERAWSVSAHAPQARSSGAGQAEQTVQLSSAWPWGFSPAAEGSAPLTLAPQPGSAWLSEQYRFHLSKDEPPALMLIDGGTTLDGRFPVIRHLRARADNPFPVFGLSRADGERLRALAATSEGPVEVRYALDAVIARERPRTVVAQLRARPGARKGFMLFCAHGDSDAGGPGANDNASGVAIVLEIASAWSQAIHDGLVEGPPCELRFAVWGKEIHSSRAYLNEHLDALAPGEAPAPLLGVVNFDQAGFGSGADQLFIEPDDLPANGELVRSLLAVLDDHTGHEGFPERWATNGSLGGTDSYVFSDSERFQKKGLPALLLYSSAWGTPRDHPRTPEQRGESWHERDLVSIDHDVHYHSSGDVPENTTDREPWNMAWCARVALLGVLRWSEGLDER